MTTEKPTPDTAHCPVRNAERGEKYYVGTQENAHCIFKGQKNYLCKDGTPQEMIAAGATLPAHCAKCLADRKVRLEAEAQGITPQALEVQKHILNDLRKNGPIAQAINGITGTRRGHSYTPRTQ